MAMTQEHWVKVKKALAYKAGDANVMSHDGIRAFELLKENWDLMNDEQALDAYLGPEEIADLQRQRDKLQAQVDALDAQIAEKQK